MKWRCPLQNVSGLPPSKRYGHTSTSVGKRAVFFGGRNGPVYNDVHILESPSAKGSKTWQRVKVAGDAPPGRSGHSAVRVGRHLLFFGGEGEEGLLCDTPVLQLHAADSPDDKEEKLHLVFRKNSQVEVLDADKEKFKWTFLDEEDPLGKPMDLAWCNHITTQGGEENSDPMTPAEAATGPVIRTSHAAALVVSNLYLLGGETSGYQLLGDLWVIQDVEQQLQEGVLVWTCVEAAGTPPPPCAGHTTTAVGPRMFAIGGSLMDAVFMLDTLCVGWERVDTIGGFASVARSHHSATQLGYKILIFGGSDENDELCEEVLCLDTKSGEWSQLQAAGQVPVNRSHHSVCLVGESLVIFGGKGMRHFNDVCALDEDPEDTEQRKKDEKALRDELKKLMKQQKKDEKKLEAKAKKEDEEAEKRRRQEETAKRAEAAVLKEKEEHQKRLKEAEAAKKEAAAGRVGGGYSKARGTIKMLPE